METTAAIQPDAKQSDGIGTRAARHLDRMFRSLADSADTEKTAGFMRLLTGEPHPMGNLAIVTDPEDPKVTQTAIRQLVERNVPAAVVYINGVASAVAASLVAQGFHADSMPAMAVDIERMTPTTLPPGYSFARAGIAESQDWADALATGYEIPSALGQLFSPEALRLDTTPDATTQCFAILKDGRAVATTLLYLADGLAGIYCVATRPEERGKGLGAHITAEALRRAHGIGYRVGILQSSAAGHSIYRRLGFEDKAILPLFLRMPA